MDVSGEFGAYLIGGWRLMGESRGSFSQLTLQNSGSVHNLYMTLMDILGERTRVCVAACAVSGTDVAYEIGDWYSRSVCDRRLVLT